MMICSSDVIFLVNVGFKHSSPQSLVLVQSGFFLTLNSPRTTSLENQNKYFQRTTCDGLTEKKHYITTIGLGPPPTPIHACLGSATQYRFYFWASYSTNRLEMN